MRNFYLALFLFVFSIKTHAYTIQKDTVLNGAKAYEYLKGAITVRLYDNTTIPAFIKFDEGTNLPKKN